MKHREKMLIHFFGPDGAGKSTQASLLIEEFRGRHLRVRYIWIRSPHTIAAMVSRYAILRGDFIAIRDELGTTTKLPAVSRSTTWKRAWIALEFLSVLPLVVSRVWIPRVMGYHLVAERCLVDSVVTIAYFIGDVSFLKHPLAELLLNLLPKSSMYFFLDADVDDIRSRRQAESESRDFLEFQRRAYALLAGKLGAFGIFTPVSRPEETHMLITRRVFGRESNPLEETVSSFSKGHTP